MTKKEREEVAQILLKLREIRDQLDTLEDQILEKFGADKLGAVFPGE